MNSLNSSIGLFAEADPSTLTRGLETITLEGRGRSGLPQRPLRTMLEDHFEHADLEAAVSMLAGVVACPSIMFGELPDDDVIAAAVDIVLSSTRSG